MNLPSNNMFLLKLSVPPFLYCAPFWGEPSTSSKNKWNDSRIRATNCKFTYSWRWYLDSSPRLVAHAYLFVKPKSAHTALAVKACLLGGNSNTKCSMTFVNIAVAISALAVGGGKNGFAPRPDFAPRPEYGDVFDIFRGFLGVWAQEGIETEIWVNLVAFRQWKNGQKWKKHCT